MVTGGGYGSKPVSKVYKPKVEPKANRANVAGVAQQGMATGFTKKPVIQGKGYEPSKMGPTGVPGYFNAAKAGPGSGRTIMRSGSQSQYGPTAPSAVNRAPDPSATGTRGRDILSEFSKDRR